MSHAQIAKALVEEATAWLENLAASGRIPGALIAVTAGGQQFIMITEINLDHVDKRDFLQWVINKERVVVYASTGRFVVEVVEGGKLAERAEIRAFSPEFGWWRSFLVKRAADKSISYEIEEDCEMPRGDFDPDDYFGPKQSSFLKQWGYANLWKRLRPHCMWRNLR